VSPLSKHEFEKLNVPGIAKQYNHVCSRSCRMLVNVLYGQALKLN